MPTGGDERGMQRPSGTAFILTKWRTRELGAWRDTRKMSIRNRISRTCCMRPPAYVRSLLPRLPATSDGLGPLPASLLLGYMLPVHIRNTSGDIRVVSRDTNGAPNGRRASAEPLSDKRRAGCGPDGLRTAPLIADMPFPTPGNRHIFSPTNDS